MGNSTKVQRTHHEGLEVNEERDYCRMINISIEVHKSLTLE